MTLILKQFINFIKLLNSETGTYQIASGLSLGMMIGFAPFFSIQTLLFFFLVFIFRIQVGAAFFSAFFFKIFAYILDPLFNQMGQKTLELEILKPLFTTLANLPLIPFTRFNNSIVMGSMMTSLVLFIPSFFIFKFLILKYRVLVFERFQNSKFWKVLTASKVYFLYQKYSNLTQS
ncbi:MAG TPA: TIGR03546 family protein [Pseudobdellovibrionaceae bacterium]|nr:TIGR03546 family protein [Pseudobdellovibrionaceae bacterium]